jgi:hypothetical protein
VAIVKHKYGHYFKDKKHLTKPHLHVYKVKVNDEGRLWVDEKEDATPIEHFFWEKSEREEHNKNFARIIEYLS